MGLKINHWDICWASVKYEDIKKFKTRPIVILFENENIFTALKCTTHYPRNNFDYQLKYCEEYNLKKITIVRTNKLICVPSKDIIRKIGKLRIDDILSINNLLKKST